MERCDALGSISEEPDQLTRPFASDAMRRAHDAVTGVDARRRDGGGTGQRRQPSGRYEGTQGAHETLLIGSHLDSVRDAGKYDGPLGVLVGIAAVQDLHDRRARLPFAIEVVGFADEEGLRYGTTYLGSRALAGTFDAADISRVDSDGVTMERRSAPLEAIQTASRKTEDRGASCLATARSTSSRAPCSKPKACL